MIALAVLLLHPALDGDGGLRLVATGVGEDEVAWIVDGVEVGVTGDREALAVPAAAGEHRVEARSAADGRWQAVVREDRPAPGAAYVPAWTAVHEPAPAGATAEGAGRQVPWLAPCLGIAAAGLMLWPGRRGLEARRRARGR